MLDLQLVIIPCDNSIVDLGQVPLHEYSHSFINHGDRHARRYFIIILLLSLLLLCISLLKIIFLFFIFYLREERRRRRRGEGEKKRRREENERDTEIINNTYIEIPLLLSCHRHHFF